MTNEPIYVYVLTTEYEYGPPNFRGVFRTIEGAQNAGIASVSHAITGGVEWEHQDVDPTGVEFWKLPFSDPYSDTFDSNLLIVREELKP